MTRQPYPMPATSRTAARPGYTVLEVLVAAGIMFALVGSLLSAWSATTDFSYMVNENLKRMETIDRLRATMGMDMNQSAQFVRYDPSVMVASVDATTNEPVTLYPAISQGGRELRFVRFRTSISAAATPGGERPYRGNLAGTNAQPLSQYALAPTTPSFVVNPAAGLPGYWNIAPVWESNRTGLTFDQNADPANLRLWRYILVPYTATTPRTIADGVTYAASSYPTYVAEGRTLCRGSLLRQYRNSGSSTWQTDGEPLSEAVVFDSANNENNTTLPCFVFATAYDGVTRTGVEQVNDNEIRLKLTVAMEPQQRGPAVLLDLRFAFPFRRIDFGE